MLDVDHPAQRRGVGDGSAFRMIIFLHGQLSDDVADILQRTVIFGKASVFGRIEPDAVRLHHGQVGTLRALSSAE